MDVGAYLSVWEQSQFLGIGQVLGAMLLSLLLASALASVYRWTFHGFSYSRSFVHTMVLGSMVTCMVIMAVGNNLARGLGILGTLAIVRFRSHVRDPRDMVFLFASLGVGIACGAHALVVAITGTGAFGAAALLLHWSPFASRRAYEGLLRFCADAELKGKDELHAVLRTYCAEYYLIAMREAAQGERMEYTYQVRLLDPSYHQNLVKAVDQIAGISDAGLLMQRATVEL